jgi:predicted GH43/DUF377 family glycosyl hydrolase
MAPAGSCSTKPIRGAWWRDAKAIHAPSLQWELVGTVPNVIFLEGATPRPGDPLDLTGYYGGADQYTGAMRIRISVQ